MKKTLWSLLIVAAVLLSACGPAFVPTTNPQTPSGEVFMIALPRIVITYDSAGNPSILGINLASFGANAGGLKLPEQTVAMLTAGNVQHIELAFAGQGVTIFVNGKLMPYVSWTDASLTTALNLAGVFGLQNVNLYKQLVPIITRFGLDIVLTFPLQSGAAEIPMTEPGAAAKVSITPTTDPPSVIAKFEVKFDENGVPAILGITTSDLAALGLNVPLALSPTTIQALQAGNIQNMEFRSKADGVFLYANGEPLPNIFWDTTLLTNMADVYAQLNPSGPYVPLVKTVVSNLDKGDIDILFHFPLAQGAEPIPAQMHP